MQSFYWHDYETWGASPAVDRPSQFAGVRTDTELNIIEDPLVIYCKPPVEIWPNPEACLVTGIIPQDAVAKGLSERDFIAKVHRSLAQPGTCGVGYNSLRFDDEVTRYTLYRNFYDPYEREWRNGNSRWDIIDMVRLVYALRPAGIEWPMLEGQPSFKLENLTAANGISHQSAHDAYSDVEATIALARLVKDCKPELYDYVLKNKGKHDVARLIDIKACKPLLHISSRFPAKRGCAGLIAPLAMHPVNKNAVIAYELSVDPSPMAQLSAEEIRERVFVAQEDLPEGVSRLPIKLIHLNKCPVLATTKLLDAKSSHRLGIDKNQCEAHWRDLVTMNRTGELAQKLVDMFAQDGYQGASDVEQRLYDGFVSDHDKQLMTELRRLQPDQYATHTFAFADERLKEMLFRYKARNGFVYLSAAEQEHWREYVSERLHLGGDNALSYDQLMRRIDELAHEYQADVPKLALLDSIADYARQHMANYAS